MLEASAVTLRADGVMHPVEVTTDGTKRPQPAVGQILRKAPSFNHQHSLLVLHNHAKARSEAEDSEQPPCCFMLCSCCTALLVIGMALTIVGCGIWSIVLYEDVKETKCKKLENVLFGFGVLTLVNVGVAILTACFRRKPGHDDEEHQHHKAGESGAALIVFYFLCVGFAIVTGNRATARAHGATNRERCDPDGDVWPQMTIMFILAFTKKRQNQVKRTCYAQSSQIRQMRKKMVEITKRQSESCDLKELVTKLIPDVFAKEIEKACAGIFPLQNVAVRKCKILSAPKFDMNRLMEVHGDYSGEEIPQPIPRKEEGDAEEAAAEED